MARPQGDRTDHGARRDHERCWVVRCIAANGEQAEWPRRHQEAPFQLLFRHGFFAGAFCNSRATSWLACGAHVSHQRRDTVPVLRMGASCARSSQSAVQ